MSWLEILGLIILMLFFPRTVGCILLGIICGGAWWYLFIPLAIVGLIIDW